MGCKGYLEVNYGLKNWMVIDFTLFLLPAHKKTDKLR